MNKKIASEIAIGIILLLAIVVGGIFWLGAKKVQAPAMQQAVVSQPAAAAQTERTQQQSQEMQTQNQETVYTNDKYGFQLTFPKNWKGYTFGEKYPDKFVTPIFISLPISSDGPINPSTGKPFLSSTPMLEIDVWTTNNWDTRLIACKSKPGNDCPSENDVLGKNDKYVLEISSQDSLPKDDPRFLTNEAFENIKKSFQWIVNQQTGETDAWQTYKDDKYGFEFKYPQSGYEFHIGNSKADEPQFFVKNSNDNDKSYYALDLDILPNDTQKDFEARIQEAKKVDQNYIATNVDGKPAYKNVYNDITVYAILDNGISFDIVTKNNDIGDKILSTFKFTK